MPILPALKLRLDHYPSMEKRRNGEPVHFCSDNCLNARLLSSNNDTGIERYGGKISDNDSHITWRRNMKNKRLILALAVLLISSLACGLFGGGGSVGSEGDAPRETAGSRSRKRPLPAVQENTILCSRCRPRWKISWIWAMMRSTTKLP